MQQPFLIPKMLVFSLMFLSLLFVVATFLNHDLALPCISLVFLVVLTFGLKVLEQQAIIKRAAEEEEKVGN